MMPKAAITVTKSAIKLIGIAIYLTCLSHQTPQRGGKQCEIFEWYDDNVYACAPCSELCDHRNVTRTERQCERRCNDYLIAKTCTYEQYYDVHMESCEPCSELCSASNITRTTEQCQNNCKAYLNKTQAPSNIEVDNLVVPDSNSQASMANQGKSSKVTITVLVISVIGVCAGGILIAVVVAKNKGTCGRRGPNYERANNVIIDIPLMEPVQESKQQFGRQVN